MKTITSQLIITELPLQVVIGVYPEERLAPQRLLLDVELDVDIQAAARSDDIQDALDYARLAQLLTTWAAEREFQLLEALAYHLMTRLLEQPRIQGVCLKLSKFPADLPISRASVVLSTKPVASDAL